MNNISTLKEWSLRIRAEFVLHRFRLWADDALNKKGLCLYGPDGLSQNSVPRDHRVAGRFARHDFLPVSGYGQGNQERRAAHRPRIADGAVRVSRPVRRYVRPRKIHAHDG